MSNRARLAAAALALACAAAAAGCGSAAHSATGVAPEAAPGGAAFLATSQVTGAGTWAVVVMGGSVARHNNFWELLLRPAGSAAWKLVTPPGVASNGGLVLADAGGRSLITAFRPSQYLTYTPLAVTRNGGLAWSPTGPLDGALADVPDALAAAPGTGHLLALLTGGAAEMAAPGYTQWSAFATRRALAATPAGRRCGLRGLTAAAFSPAGMPLLAGTCGHPGVAGIFSLRNGTWQAAGPPVPGAVRRDVVTVLRLTLAGSRIAALLTARNGDSASLLAAWSDDGGARWTVSAPLRLGAAQVSAASFAPDGTIVLNGTAAAFVPVGGGAWRSLPAVPAGTATLAPGQAGGFDALAVHGTRLTVWQFESVTGTWRATQALHVPIQFGSSG